MYLSAPLYTILDKIDTLLLARWALRIAGVVVVWIVVWIMVRYLTRWIKHIDEHNEHFDISRRDLKTLDRVLDYIVITIGIILTLALLGWTNLLISALTAAGVFTIVVGFAVKDVAANFISGIFILFDQPFVPGDFIEVADFSGTVQSISLRSTTIVTIDGPLVHIPNSVVAIKPTINFSLAEDRRISFSISIAQDADVDKTIQLITGILNSEEGLLPERPQLVLVNDVREYAVDISVICHAPKDTFFALASDLRQRVMTTLQENDIELAVPVRKNVYPDPALGQVQPTHQE